MSTPFMRSFVRGVVRRARWTLVCGVLIACTESHAVGGTLLDGAISLGNVADGDVSLDGADAATPDPGSSATGSPGAGCFDCQGADLLGFLQFPPCCTTDDKCGLDFSALAGTPLCMERDAPGSAEPRCPSVMVSTFLLPGCCRPDRTCGVVSTLIPLGCISGDIATLLPGGGGGSGQGGAAAPMTCTPQ